MKGINSTYVKDRSRAIETESRIIGSYKCHTAYQKRKIGRMFFTKYKTEYALFRGEDNTGRLVIMDGWTTDGLNKKYEDSFMNGKTERLYVWKMTKRALKQYREDKNKFMMSMLGYVTKDLEAAHEYAKSLSPNWRKDGKNSNQ